MSQNREKLICCVIETQGKDLSICEKNGLHLIPYRDITAVTYRVEKENFEKMGKEELNRWLLWYQKVNVTFFHSYTMVPLRFGNITQDTTTIKDFLARTYLHIKSALNRVREKCEFVVKVSWDLSAFLREIARDKQEWVDKLDVSKKVEVGKLLFEAAEKKREIISNTTHQKLSRIASEWTENTRKDASLLMDRSYLIEQDEEAVFDEEMESLGKENKAYLTFRYFGPLPPYSFVPLEFNLANVDVIDEARNTLELPERTSLQDIKRNFKKLSLRYHPDRNALHQACAEHFRRVTRAYDVLRAYCLSVGEVSEYSFLREDVEKTFVVKNKIP
ncbi:GvpL/GvpF family gas vesicle protein [Candidatus Aerophobetes bacterium]|nr:GvpL/GvpF family gas vesicle protein [Candidatus Aerophobetes bacterium]